MSIRGLHIAFPAAPGGSPRTVVEGVDLDLHRGECVALVGESGSGKSVTARSLLALSGPGAHIEAERYRMDGRDALRFSASDWRALRGTFAGLVMQDALVSLDPLRNIGQEVGEVLVQHRLLGSAAAVRQRVHDSLVHVGVPDPAWRARQYAHQLSGGLRQRTLIAAAIAAQPPLLIADEPTTALDASVQRQVLDVLAARVRQDGCGLLLISHDLAVVADIADRVLVMRGGRVVEAGPTARVLGQPQHAYTRQLLAAIPSAASRGYRLSSARLRSAVAGVRLAEASAASEPEVERQPLPERPAAAGDPVLRVEAIGKRYARAGSKESNEAFVALDDVSFELRAGEVLGVVGESGSGKSTCAKIVLGLLETETGHVELLGQRWSGVPERLRQTRRSRLQYIPQDPLSSFDPRYRVDRVIAENLPPQPGGMRQREAEVARLLKQVGLDGSHAQRHPRSLSGGQRQRVAIARALAAEPAIIVCDEPVSALDVSVQAQVIDLIAELQARLGTALLFISHDIGLVQHLADRVLVLQHGRVVEQGPVQQVLGAPRHAYTQALLAARPRLLT